MRIESAVASVSWIPSEAVSGLMKAGFTTGLSHYDSPPPGQLDDLGPALDRLREQDTFRFANVLSGWAEFGAGGVTGFGQDGGTVMGSSTVRVGPFDATFAAITLPELRAEPIVTAESVTFSQTCGGRTALPIPRRISAPPFFRLAPPIVWTTLRLTLRSNGRSEFELAGASPFPRHWVYDASGTLTLKAGLTDWAGWLAQPSQDATPWGADDSAPLVTAAETALERELSAVIMRGGAKPRIRTLAAGDVLAEQGAPGDSLFLVLDGVVHVSVDGLALGDLGPGAVLGERAILENGPRTATLTALTALRVAEAAADSVDRTALAELAKGHRREISPEISPAQ
jgi:Cyclic nucleotide-binding domain